MHASTLLKEVRRGLVLAPRNTTCMLVGIVIGIAAVTTIVALGQGAKAKVLDRMKRFGFGPNVIYIGAGGGKRFRARPRKTTTLTFDDVQGLWDLPNVRLVAPYQRERRVRIIARRQNVVTSVEGVTPLWRIARGWEVADGRFITEEDLRARRKVVVLGTTPARKLFGTGNPLGRLVRIKNIPFRVVGLFGEHGVSESGYDPDDRTLVPLTTSAAVLFRRAYLDSIRIILDDVTRQAVTVAAVSRLLRANHALAEAVEDDFRIVTPEALLRWITESGRTLTLMLVLIATVALFVSGIVIANIMLVAVQERRSEIGLRRSLGATRRNIMIQFLAEAGVVGLLGGSGGCVLGYGVAHLVAAFMNYPPLLSLRVVAVALAFAVTTGLAAGLHPARVAARLDPVEALR
ncbi:MAG: ABC transporter permease [Nitrospinae bacterium]|nr:ABC transporter permease [Nitrospinota bacterium]